MPRLRRNAKQAEGVTGPHDIRLAAPMGPVGYAQSMPQQPEAQRRPVRASTVVVLVAAGGALLLSLVPSMVLAALGLAVASLAVATLRSEVIRHRLDKVVLALAGIAIAAVVVWLLLGTPATWTMEETTLTPDSPKSEGN